MSDELLLEKKNEDDLFKENVSLCDTVSKDDIENLLKKCMDRMKNNGPNETDKPNLAFIGDSGSGKTSIIRLLMKDCWDTYKLVNELPIVHSGQKGTSDEKAFIKIEGKYCNFYDVVGKEFEQSEEKYLDYIQNQIKNKKIKIDAFIFVMDASRTKDDDVQSYANIADKLCNYYSVKCLVLLNKIDKTEKNRLEERMKQIDNLFQIKRWGGIISYKKEANFQNYSVFKGVCPVSAAPTIRFENCPGYKPIFDDKQNDLGINHLVVLYLDRQVLLCKDCCIGYLSHNLYDGKMDAGGNVNIEDIKNELVKQYVENMKNKINIQQFKICYPNPEGFSLNEPFLKAIRSVLNENDLDMFYLNAFIESKSKTLVCEEIISEMIKHAYSREGAPNVDRNMCNRIFKHFELVGTSSMQSENEINKWMKLSDSAFDKIRNFWNRISKERKSVMQLYLYSCGVFYVLKAYSLRKIIQSGLSAYFNVKQEAGNENKSKEILNELYDECKKKLKSFSIQLFYEIFKKVESEGYGKATSFYFQRLDEF